MFGAKLVIKRGSGIIRPIFILALILLLIKIIYDLLIRS
jgi:uncharacterized membrane protein YfcA